ncbi:hypothetical protein IAT38_005720 [Cryptococcus sp. DSM 104549]
MSTDPALIKEAEAVLKAVSISQNKPNDSVLFPLYRFLIPQSGESSSSTAAAQEDHWYCSKAVSALHREAATYLIFLFAFNRTGTPQAWVEKVEEVVSGCEQCARGFASARRRLESKYLSNWPPHVRKNFFATVDKWQGALVLAKVEKAADPGYRGTTSSSPKIYALDRPMTQLLFGEPSLLNDDTISTLVDEAVQSATPPPTTLTALGITPTLVRLLASSDAERRKWALLQLPAASRKPLSFAEWCSLGIGIEVQELYGDVVALDGGAKWEAMAAIIRNKVLDKGAIEGGLLAGQLEGEPRRKMGRGLMSVLSGLLGSDVPFFPSVLSCFSAILRASPTRHIWSFDSSPELPHTLLSELRINPALQTLLDSRYPTVLESDEVIMEDARQDKGKGKKKESDGPLDWLGDYLISLVDAEKNSGETTNRRDSSLGAGMPEALAVGMNMMFQELQHVRLSSEMRAAAALAGFEALTRVHQSLTPDDTILHNALSSTLDLHSSFICNVALRAKDHPLPAWLDARAAARDLLVTFFRADAESTTESLMALAKASNLERKRLALKRRGRADVPAPIPLNNFPLASAKKELWSMAYDALSTRDAAGAAILIRSIAPFAHIEKLDVKGSWSYEALDAIIRKEDWTMGVRAINAAIVATRDSFPRAMESLAITALPEVIEDLWKEPDMPKAITTLLLSPDDDIHSPIISIIQQSFDDVDDRGDCFRALLEHHPHLAMDGLITFLQTFIKIANVTPESCSLAKWLVRCFHDVLEALCGQSGSSAPLLQNEEFLSSHAGGRSMARSLEELWHLMTTSLALIFKRTLDWAPLFENDVMVDWMRDALIFGRQMTEHVRAFESAVLGGAGGRMGDGMPESPMKQTSVGKRMTKQLEVVLTDLILWLRLTDVETLFQTHQLIKTILQRIAKSTTDVAKTPLEKTLLEIEKFCRKVSKSFTSRLTDDLLSELSELLVPFDLDVDDVADVQFVKEVATTKAPSERGSSRSTTPVSASVKAVSKPPLKNAFAEMMRASGGKPKAEERTAAKKDDADEFDDDFFDTMSIKDLEILEKRALAKQPSSSARPGVPTKPPVQSKLQTSARPLPPSSRLHVNLVPRPAPKPTGSASFTSKVMKELRKEQIMSSRERKRAEAGSAAPKLPTPSVLGTGLGAYTGPPKPKVLPPVDSGSSASEESDDEREQERAALKELAAKQKAPVRPMPVEKRSIKVLGGAVSDMHRRNEERRANAHATKQRLKPDMNPLYRYVLSWNPSHKGPLAPHGEKFKAELSALKPVPNVFNSAKQYEQVMLPLFMQELWAQSLKGDGVGKNGSTLVEVAFRQYEDDFIEVDLILHGRQDFWANDSDVVILKQAESGVSMFAKVVAFKRKPKNTTFKVRVLSSMDRPELCGRSKWMLQKHIALSTAMREFGALKGLPWYESSLLGDILAARSAIMPKLALDDIEEAMEAYSLNEPQAKAVLGALHVKGFALIQGPPGTGKTKTISGLVGKWLSERRIPMAVDGQRPVKPKLLVCAPSNAAIDEVCKRLSLGVPSSSGGRLNPIIVRIGMDASVNMAVKDLSLDSLVEARINQEHGKKDGGGEYARIQADLEDVKQRIKDKQEELRQAQNNEERRKVVENEYHSLVTQRARLGQEASKAKDAARDATRYLDGARRAARDLILNEADIVCATLSGAGQDSLAPHTFETVIIDEAAQAIEMSCLIPLKYGCKRCIMVGDPNQLPPTTFSTEAEKNSYNQSLFVRITKRDPTHVQLLSIQYRMHPNISELPSKVFYDGRLRDGPDMAKKTAALWHQRHVFGPYRFFNIQGHERQSGTSTRNPDEAKAAVELYRRLDSDFGTRVNLAMRVGVITMYKEQLFELKDTFKQAFGASIVDLIEFNTVDGFQGQEKDIIILSCVRSGPNLQTIGFLRDVRRMNVALTRAKSSLFVFGNGPTLERNDPRWKIIVQDAKERGFFINYTSSTFSADAIEPPPSTKAAKPPTPSSGLKSPFSRPLPAPVPEGLLPPKALAIEMATPVAKKRDNDDGKVKRKPSVELVKEKKKARPLEIDGLARPGAMAGGGGGGGQSSKASSSTTSSRIPPPAGPSRPPLNGSLSKPSSSRPPAPPNAARPPPPPKPARPAPPPEDVLFIKKKKKVCVGRSLEYI